MNWDYYSREESKMLAASIQRTGFTALFKHKPPLRNKKKYTDHTYVQHIRDDDRQETRYVEEVYYHGMRGDFGFTQN